MEPKSTENSKAVVSLGTVHQVVAEPSVHANLTMEPKSTENPNTLLPPGTVHLVAEQSDKIILVPKPSADPDDPLNWSKGRKWLNVSLLLFYVFSTGIGGTSVYSVFTPISKETGITIAQLNNGTGYLFLMAGWTNIIWQPLALTFGRRPIILTSLLFCVAISEWTAWIDRYPSWAAGKSPLTESLFILEGPLN